MSNFEHLAAELGLPLIDFRGWKCLVAGDAVRLLDACEARRIVVGCVRACQPGPGSADLRRVERHLPGGEWASSIDCARRAVAAFASADARIAFDLADERQCRARDTAERFEVETVEWSLLWDFGWFDLTHFRVWPSREWRTAADLMQGFVSDTIFRRALQGPFDPWRVETAPGQLPLHGPYRINDLPAGCFVPIGHDELRRRIDSVFRDEQFVSPPSPEQAVRVSEWLESVSRSGSAAFVLEAPASAEVEWNYFDPLVEFAAVRDDLQQLSVAFIGYD